MEKFLLKNMTQLLFIFCGIIFFTWLFQYLNLSFLNPIQLPFLKEYKFEGIISTFQMFTVIGAIFAFWYGYKKYENDKKIKHLENIGNNAYNINIIDQIIKLELMYKFHNELVISDEVWSFIEKDSWINFKSKVNDFIDSKIEGLSGDLHKDFLETKKEVEELRDKIKKGSQINIEDIEDKIKKSRVVMDKKIDDSKSIIANKLGAIFLPLFSSNNKDYRKYIIKKFEELVEKSSKNSTTDEMFKEMLSMIKKLNLN